MVSFLKNIVDYAKQHQITLIPVLIPNRELVVNQVDTHPNEWINQQVSEVLLKLVQERVK